jgi:hypothetical protein
MELKLFVDDPLTGALQRKVANRRGSAAGVKAKAADHAPRKQESARTTRVAEAAMDFLQQP